MTPPRAGPLALGVGLTLGALAGGCWDPPVYTFPDSDPIPAGFVATYAQALCDAYLGCDCPGYADQADCLADVTAALEETIADGVIFRAACVQATLDMIETLGCDTGALGQAHPLAGFGADGKYPGCDPMTEAVLAARRGPGELCRDEHRHYAYRECGPGLRCSTARRCQPIGAPDPDPVARYHPLEPRRQRRGVARGPHEPPRLVVARRPVPPRGLERGPQIDPPQPLPQPRPATSAYKRTVRIAAISRMSQPAASIFDTSHSRTA